MKNIFFISFAISFLGSIPPGTINLSILEYAGGGNFSGTIKRVFTASILEVIHILVAFWIHFQFLDGNEFKNFALPVSIIFMLVLAVVMFKGSKKTNYKPLTFKSFLIVNLFNMMAIPFWLSCLQLLPAVEGISTIPVFVAGATTGAFLSLSAFGIIGYFLQNKEFISPKKLGQLIALCLFGMAGWQTYLLFQQYKSSIQILLQIQL